MQALYEHLPPATDVSGRCSWNACMVRGYLRLASIDVSAFLLTLPRLCAALLEGFLEESTDLARNAFDNLSAVIDQGLALAAEPIKAAAAVDSSGQQTPVHQLISVLASGLRFRYQSHHKMVLQVLAHMFTRLGASAHPLADKILVSLAEVSLFT
jgi:hypothetical protein